MSWVSFVYSSVLRYKPLCPDTWPNWKGTAAEGVRCLVKHLGYKSNEYKMGRYKHMLMDGISQTLYGGCRNDMSVSSSFFHEGQKSSSAIPELCLQQKTPSRSANIS